MAGRVYSIVLFHYSYSQDQQCQEHDQDRQTKQIYIANNISQSFKNTVKQPSQSLLYSSQLALNLVKFIKTAVFVTNLHKKDYNFMNHTC